MFLNIYEKITTFCQVLKEMHRKENWFIFSASLSSLISRVWTKLESSFLQDGHNFCDPTDYVTAMTHTSALYSYFLDPHIDYQEAE